MKRKRMSAFFRQWMALLCALALLPLTPAASAAEYQYTWISNNNSEFAVRFVLSVKDLNNAYTLRSYSSSGAQLPENPLAHVYAVEDGSEAQQIVDDQYSAGNYDYLTVTGCSVSISGSTIEIWDTGAAFTLSTGDIMSKSSFGGYDAIRYHKEYRYTADQNLEADFYFLLGDTLGSGGSGKPGVSTITNPGTPTDPGVSTDPVTPEPQPAVTYSGAPGHSSRGNTLSASGNGYELIWTDGALTNSNTGVQDNRRLLVDSYDASFHKTGSKELKIELEEIGAAYYGETYNFLVFGQDNLEENDNKELIRIVKYSKDWQRLGALSLSNAAVNGNPVSDIVDNRFSNLSFAECNGILYIHCARQGYADLTGIQHQGNLTFSVRESDMSLADGQDFGAMLSQNQNGNISHSFTQDIMVDSQGNLVTLDTGDSHPRGLFLFRFSQKAGGSTFFSKGEDALLTAWPGQNGDNITGGRGCDLAETSRGYLSAYIDTKLGGSSTSKSVFNAYLTLTPKDSFSASASTTRALTSLSTGASESVSSIMLFPTDMAGGYVLWYTGGVDEYGYYSGTGAVYYAPYSADGSIGSVTKLDNVQPPYGTPVYQNGKLTWCSQPPDSRIVNPYNPLQFYTVDLSSGRLSVVNPAGSGTTAENPFTDVPAGSYYYDAVLWAVENGITTGVTATTFSPQAACTRGQVVTFLWRANGEPEPKTTTNPFTDVSASSPFCKAILWAYENDITTGTSPTTFNPGGTCTSGHVVTFLWRAKGEPAASGSSALAGSYPGKYYTDAVAWADTAGLLSGTGTAFNPAAQSPRADIVTYLYRDLTA